MTDPGVNPGESESGTSPSLLERIRAHDRAAWERLVALYGLMVYGWCLRAGLQPADAADIGQEVFAAVARSIDGFRHDRARDTFRGWLFTITRNKIRDHCTAPGNTGAGGSDALRRFAELPAEQWEDENCDAEDDETRALYRRAIEYVRAEFTTQTWEAFWRTFVDGHAPADVAADLGVSANVVYLAKSRVLRRVRAEFAAVVDFGKPGKP